MVTTGTGVVQWRAPARPERKPPAPGIPARAVRSVAASPAAGARGATQPPMYCTRSNSAIALMWLIVAWSSERRAEVSWFWAAVTS